MKKLGIIDIEENMEYLFEENLGGRNNNLLGMLKLIGNIDDNMVLAIDGSWGTGKTIFVKQLEYLLKSSNNGKNLKKVLEKDPSYEIKNDYITVYYDAWENDDCENPLESLLYSLAQSFCEVKSTKNKNVVEKILNLIKCINFSVGGGVIPVAVSTSFEDIGNAVKSEDLLEEFKKKESVKVALKKVLVSLFEDNDITKIIFFIDEVDRCKPTFAMELLEKIKHLFDDENIIFVFSTNLEQLENTVKKCYGESFAAYEYLDKIFDLRLGLNEIQVDEYMLFLLKGSKVFVAESTMGEYLGELARCFEFGLRQCERYAMQMKIVDKYMNNMPKKFSDEEYERAKIFLFLPIVLGIKLKGTNQYKSFLKGESVEEFKLLMEECACGKNIANSLSKKSEMLNQEELVELYKMTFSDKEMSKSGKTFSAKCKGEILRTISLLNSNAEYFI